MANEAIFNPAFQPVYYTRVFNVFTNQITMYALVELIFALIYAVIIMGLILAVPYLLTN